MSLIDRISKRWATRQKASRIEEKLKIRKIKAAEREQRKLKEEILERINNVIEKCDKDTVAGINVSFLNDCDYSQLTGWFRCKDDFFKDIANIVFIFHLAEYYLNKYVDIYFNQKFLPAMEKCRNLYQGEEFFPKEEIYKNLIVMWENQDLHRDNLEKLSKNYEEQYLGIEKLNEAAEEDTEKTIKNIKYIEESKSNGRLNQEQISQYDNILKTYVEAWSVNKRTAIIFWEDEDFKTHLKDLKYTEQYKILKKIESHSFEAYFLEKVIMCINTYLANNQIFSQEKIPYKYSIDDYFNYKKTYLQEKERNELEDFFTSEGKRVNASNESSEEKNNILKIESIDQMNGAEFEDFCAKLYQAKGYIVEQTPLSGDHGADLIAKAPDNKVYVIQCKRYSNTVSNTAIQEIYAAKSYYNADYSCVVTNSYFTQGARKLAKATNTLLVDRDSLILDINYLQNVL